MDKSDWFIIVTALVLWLIVVYIIHRNSLSTASKTGTIRIRSKQVFKTAEPSKRYLVIGESVYNPEIIHIYTTQDDFIKVSPGDVVIYSYGDNVYNDRLVLLTPVTKNR